MWRNVDAGSCDERAMRAQILAFLDEYCRGMTLADVREWYADAVGADAPVYAEGGCP
jgi:hypothetical protein